MDMPAALQRQVGPFTVGGWLLIGGAGIGAGLLLRRVLPHDSTPAEDDPTTATVEGDGTIPDQPGARPYNTQQPLVGGGSGVPLLSTRADDYAGRYTPTTNLEWGNYVVALLINRGIPASEALMAVNRYLTGQELTDRQLSIVGEAVTIAGSPPEGAPAPVNDEPDTPPPADEEEEPPPVTTPPVYTPPVYTPPVINPPVVPSGPTPTSQQLQAFITFLRVWLTSELGRGPTPSEQERAITYWKGRIAAGRPVAGATTDVKVWLRPQLGMHV